VNIDHDQYTDLINVNFDETAYLNQVNNEQMKKRDKARIAASFKK
jgi:hypothetical protein